MSLKWISASHGEVMPHAGLGGQDDGNDIYVGRANHEGDMVPGKVMPKEGCIYICWCGKEEHRYFYYEVLVNRDSLNITWTGDSAGNFPAVAVKGGQQRDGTPLYVARAVAPRGGMTPGKLNTSHGCCRIPYDGKEIACTSYEVLQIV